MARLRALGISISVSSLRVKPLPVSLVQALQDSGSQSITLAPEAGSERLRRAIAKGVTQQDLLDAAKMLAGRFSSLKLYYMIGLPSETDADVDEIAALSAEAQRAFGREVVVNVTPFVPKAHTPYEREAVCSERLVDERLRRLQSLCRARRLPFRGEDARQAQVQAVLARGDEAVGEALLAQEQPGMRGFWRALEQQGLEAKRYLEAQPVEATLPWGFVALQAQRAGEAS